jgi:hypothetical protein
MAANPGRGCDRLAVAVRAAVTATVAARCLLWQWPAAYGLVRMVVVVRGGVEPPTFRFSDGYSPSCGPGTYRFQQALYLHIGW